MKQTIIKKTLAVAIVVVACGVSVIPLTSYAADDCTLPASGSGVGLTSAACDVRVNVNVSSYIELTASYVNDAGQTIDITSGTNPVATTLQPGTTKDVNVTAKVSTNNLNGYKLTLKDADTNTNLVRSGGTETIPTSPTISTTASAWGVKAYNAAAYSAVPASNATALLIRNVGTQTAALVNHPTLFKFGFSATDTQRAGTYTDNIILTATAN